MCTEWMVNQLRYIVRVTVYLMFLWNLVYYENRWVTPISNYRVIDIPAARKFVRDRARTTYLVVLIRKNLNACIIESQKFIFVRVKISKLEIIFGLIYFKPDKTSSYLQSLNLFFLGCEDLFRDRPNLNKRRF